MFYARVSEGEVKGDGLKKNPVHYLMVGEAC